MRNSNPEGIPSLSPGLRGTSYAGCASNGLSTPTGLRRNSGHASENLPGAAFIERCQSNQGATRFALHDPTTRCDFLQPRGVRGGRNPVRRHARADAVHQTAGWLHAAPPQNGLWTPSSFLFSWKFFRKALFWLGAGIVDDFKEFQCGVASENWGGSAAARDTHLLRHECDRS